MSTKYPGYVSTTYTLEYPVPPVPVPQYPPTPAQYVPPRGRGSWWYGDDEGCWVRVRYGDVLWGMVDRPPLGRGEPVAEHGSPCP
jgi:hypothetical protein